MLKEIKNIHFVILLCAWSSCIISMDPPEKPKYKNIREAVLADDQDAVVDFMMTDHGDINKEDEHGKTLFQLALEKERRAVAHFMFWHGGIVEPENINDFIRHAFYPELHNDDAELFLIILRESDLSQLIKSAKKSGIDWILRLGTAQARVKVVEAMLNLKNPRLTQEMIDKTISSLDDILKHSTHTDAQRARYRRIRYLLSGKNIHTTIEIGDDDCVDQYIHEGGDVNVPDKEGATPIQIAMRTSQRDIAEKLALNGARYPQENVTLLGEIFCHQSCIRGELTQAIFANQAGKVIIHIQDCQGGCTPFALRLSIAQGQVACVTRLLTLVELSPEGLGCYLELVHRILHSTPHNPGQRARYETIRDLLMIHGSQLKFSKVARQLEELKTLFTRK